MTQQPAGECVLDAARPNDAAAPSGAKPWLKLPKAVRTAMGWGSKANEPDSQEASTAASPVKATAGGGHRSRSSAGSEMEMTDFSASMGKQNTTTDPPASLRRTMPT